MKFQKVLPAVAPRTQPQGVGLKKDGRTIGVVYAMREFIKHKNLRLTGSAAVDYLPVDYLTVLKPPDSFQNTG